MASRRTFQGTRVPAIVGATLAVVLGGGAIAIKALKGGKPADRTTRAVIVPTADRARTVVIPPCGTGVPVTAGNAASQMRTLGATTIQLPHAPGVRVVVVPRCSAGKGKSGTVPSAAFVLKAGSPVVPPKPAGGTVGSTSGVLSQLIVPTGSDARLIVVPQCTRSATPRTAGNGRQVVLTPRADHPGTAIAPPC